MNLNRLNFALSAALKRFPSAHSAVKQYYTRTLITKSPKVHPRGFKLLGSPEMQEGKFEPDETEQLLQLLGQCDCFVNIGANVGYYVCLARQLGKRVVAIEPLDRNVQLLKTNLANNDWLDVEVLPVGLGQHAGLMKLYGGGTAASLVTGWAGASAQSFELIPVTTLDNVLADRFQDQRLLILMDVEGYELNVLKGALRQLNREPAPTWFVEVCIDEHQPGETKINPNLLETFNAFWNAGYVADKAGCETGRVIKEDVIDWTKGKNLPGTHNFIFSRSMPVSDSP